jgi:hypothetical protein
MEVTMKNVPLLLGVGIGLLLGVLAGFGLGRVNSGASFFPKGGAAGTLTSGVSLQGSNPLGSGAPPAGRSVTALSELSGAALGDPDQIIAEVKRLSLSGSMFDKNRGIYELASRLSPEQARAAFEKFSEGNIQRGADWMSIMAFAQRWAGADPLGALEKTKEMNPFQQQAVVSTVFDSLARQDQSEALRLMEQLETPQLRASAFQAITHALSQTDPEAAVALAQREGNRREGRWVLQNALAQLAVTDPVKAFDEALKMPASRDSHAIQTVAATWARKDREAALRKVESLENPSQKSGAMAGIMREWAQSDPLAALTYASALSSEGVQGEAIQSVLLSWSQKDPAAAAKWVEANAGRVDLRQSVEILTSNWANSDPEAAAKFTLALPTGETRTNAIRNLVSTWSQQDPVAAAAWLSKNGPAGDEARNIWSNLARTWARNDPRASAAYVETVADARVAREMANQVAQSWAESDAQGALNWASSLKDAEVRNSAVGQVLGRWAHHDPQGAAVQALQLPEAARPEAVKAVMRSWADRHPTQASQWASALPEGSAKNNAVGEVARHWLRRDLNSAVQWTNSLKDGPARDAAVLSFFHHFRQHNPAQAFAWAQSLSSEELYVARTKESAQRWLQVDRPSAEKAIKDSDLPANEKAALLSQ